MDQQSSGSAASVVDTPPIRLAFDLDPASIRGRIIPNGGDSKETLPALRLMAGPAVLGMIRTSIEASADDADNVEGHFRVLDYGLGAFARITSLDDVRITTEVAGELSAEFPLPASATEVSPLGSRGGVGKALRLADAWMQSDRELSLRFESSANVAKSLDAYQYVGTRPVIVAADRSINGSTVVSMILVNRFAPVLLVFKGDDGAIDAIDIVPFPSLLRGGLHAAERLIVTERSDDLSEAAGISGELVKAWIERMERPERCVAAVEIEASVQTGMEPILNPDLLEWINRAFGIGIRFAPGDKAGIPQFITEAVAPYASSGGNGHVLHLPADCVPTISALVRSLPENSASETLSGGMGIVDWNRHGRVWSICQPTFTGSLESLQPRTSHRLAPELTVRGGTGISEPSKIALTWPLALAFRELPTRMTRNDPFEFPTDIDGPLLRSGTPGDTSAVDAIILSAGERLDPIPLLESLSKQEGLSLGQILVCAAPEISEDLATTLEAMFPGRHKIVRLTSPQGRLTQLVAARDLLGSSGRVIVADAGTVLPDPRTMSTLLKMLELNGVASAGCLLRHATEKMTPIAAGYSLCGLDLRSVPTASFGPIDPAIFRNPATYPIIANSLLLVATRIEMLADLSAEASSLADYRSDDLLFGIHLLRMGGVNLCTTAVSAYAQASGGGQISSSFSVPYRQTLADLATYAESGLIAQRIV